MRKYDLKRHDDANAGRAARLRNEFGDYIKVGDVYDLLGVGFTQLDENPGAQSDSEVYINEVTASASINSYQTVFPFSTRMIPADPGVMEIYNIGRDHATGDDAVREYVRVDLFNPIDGGEAGEYKARLFRVAVEVSGMSGNGGEKIAVAGNLNAQGDPVQGKFNTTTKEFTEGKFVGKHDPKPASGEVAAG